MSELQTYAARVLFPVLNGTGDLIKKSDHKRIVAELEQQLEAARKDAERYRAHIQESADRADRAITSLNLTNDNERHKLLSVLRDWHLAAIEASKAGVKP